LLALSAPRGVAFERSLGPNRWARPPGSVWNRRHPGASGLSSALVVFLAGLHRLRDGALPGSPLGLGPAVRQDRQAGGGRTAWSRPRWLSHPVDRQTSDRPRSFEVPNLRLGGGDIRVAERHGMVRVVGAGDVDTRRRGLPPAERWCSGHSVGSPPSTRVRTQAECPDAQGHASSGAEDRLDHLVEV